MRRLADASRVRSFLSALGRRTDEETRVYLTGGSTAVLLGWRDSTVDADILERGHVKDRSDVEEMIRRGLVLPAQLRELFLAIEPRFDRYPAVDPPSFRRRLEELLAKVGP